MNEQSSSGGRSEGKACPSFILQFSVPCIQLLLDFFATMIISKINSWTVQFPTAPISFFPFHTWKLRRKQTLWYHTYDCIKRLFLLFFCYTLELLHHWYTTLSPNLDQTWTQCWGEPCIHGACRYEAVRGWIRPLVHQGRYCWVAESC